MHRSAMLALGAGAASGLASVALAVGSFGGVLIAWLAPLPLFLIGLGFGPRPAAIAAAVGFMVSGLLGGTMAAGLYGLLHAVPAWMVIRLGLSHGREADGTVTWYPPGGILAWLGLFGGMLLVAAATALWGDGGLSATVESHMGEALGQMAPNLAPAEREAFLGDLVPLFPAAVGSSWMVLTAINAALAQTILIRSGRNLRPSPPYAGLRLPDWSSWALVAAAALGLLGPGELEYIGRNLTVVLAVPFFFVGLAVAHALANRTGYGTMVLAAFYLLLLVSSWIMMLVAGAGVVEQWVGIRDRVAAPGKSETPDDGEES